MTSLWCKTLFGFTELSVTKKRSEPLLWRGNPDFGVFRHPERLHASVIQRRASGRGPSARCVLAAGVDERHSHQDKQSGGCGDHAVLKTCHAALARGAARSMERFAFRATVAGKRADAGRCTSTPPCEPFFRRVRYPSARSQMRCATGGVSLWPLSRRYLRPIYYTLVRLQPIFCGAMKITCVLSRASSILHYPGGRLLLQTELQSVMQKESVLNPRTTINPNLERLVKWNQDDDVEQLRSFRDVFFIHRLGNLVLDAQAAGASKGNNDFSNRIPHYRQSGLLSHAEIVSQFAILEFMVTMVN